MCVTTGFVTGADVVTAGTVCDAAPLDWVTTGLVLVDPEAACVEATRCAPAPASRAGFVAIARPPRPLRPAITATVAIFALALFMVLPFVAGVVGLRLCDAAMKVSATLR